MPTDWNGIWIIGREIEGRIDTFPNLISSYSSENISPSTSHPPAPPASVRLGSPQTLQYQLWVASALQDLTHRPRRLKISHRKKIARRYFPCDVNKTGKRTNGTDRRWERNANTYLPRYGKIDRYGSDSSSATRRCDGDDLPLVSAHSLVAALRCSSWGLGSFVFPSDREQQQ